MTLKDFLLAQEWAVYRIDTAKRKFFGDTFFGPMWKDFPAEVIIPDGLILDSLLEVEKYIKGE